MYCNKVIEGDRRRTSFCSNDCKEAFFGKYWEDYLIQSDNAYIRQIVYLRDKGICSRCGKDVIEFKQTAQEEIKNSPSYMLSSIKYKYSKMGFDFHRASWWDAHHLVAVKDGGGQCGIDNYVTLCLKCHKEVHSGK